MDKGEWIGNLRTRQWPSEGRWIAKPRKPRFGIVHIAFFGLYIQVLVQLPNLLNLQKHLHTLWIFFAIYAVLLAIPLSFLLVQAFARRERPSDRALMDAAFGDQFPAELTIVVNQKRIGADRGAVWFADGLMGYSGRSASFVLAAEDVEPQYPGVTRPALGRAMPADSIVLNDAPYHAYIVMTPLRGHEKAYRERLKRFKDDDARSEGERFWPPLEPYDAAALPQGGASEAVRR